MLETAVAPTVDHLGAVPEDDVRRRLEDAHEIARHRRGEALSPDDERDCASVLGKMHRRLTG